MLFIHETHSVVGRCEDEFEEAFRGPDGYMQRVAQGSPARLLWYLDHAHGTGPAYTVVTVTAVPDAEAWAHLAARMAEGDLRDWVGTIDQLRYDAVAKILRPLPWSGLTSVELEDVPTEPVERKPVLFMEDTANPRPGRVHDYIRVAGQQYAPSLRRSNPLLEMVAAFQPLFGTGRRREILLWQRVADEQALLRLLTTPVPEAMKAPGTWMHDALDVRDQWTSRLLRTSPWSPLG